MVNNQKEFNEKYNNKEIEEIKIEDEYDFEGQLVIEGYPNLERLRLRDIDSIEKITLKNLPQLQECTIWDCGMKELVIENCLSIEILNVRTNSLTSLEFLLNLRNLTELEITGNPELIKILKPYNGDWRRWKGLQIHHPRGSSYHIQNKEKVELETKIAIPPKGGN